ncbi:hypothetical protein C0995_003985, partial [Termitomyces sp. Mi166
MAFYTQSIIATELNYDIYDKELLAIVEALSENWSLDHPFLAWLSSASSASPSSVTLAVSQAAGLYPNTFHQHLLYHLGQLASQPPYVTSTASAKP